MSLIKEHKNIDAEGINQEWIVGGEKDLMQKKLLQIIKEKEHDLFIAKIEKKQIQREKEQITASILELNQKIQLKDKKVAEKMLSIGITIEYILELTNLNIEDIIKIQKSIKNRVFD